MADVETREHGRPSAMDDLYRSHRLAMVRLAAVITGSPAVGEEVVQEAFLTLYRRWDHVDNPGGYLRTIVTNLSIAALRRQRLEGRHLAPPAVLAELPELDETWGAVCRLPERQRAVLALRFYEDLSERQIAAVLGCRVGTVKSSLHRGLARLRKELT